MHRCPPDRDDFADGEERPTVAVARKRDRLRMPDRPGATAPAYLFESLGYPVTDRKLQAFHAEFPEPSKASEPHRHDGAELVYVLRGRLVVTVDGDDTALDEGDAMYFDPEAPHSYRREGPSPCAAIVVVAPGPGRDPGPGAYQSPA